MTGKGKGKAVTSGSRVVKVTGARGTPCRRCVHGMAGWKSNSGDAPPRCEEDDCKSIFYADSSQLTRQ